MTNETKGAGRAVEDSLCWGIFRERAHSPGRETDDEAILRRTGERLTDLGYDVRLLDPADIDEVLGETRPKVFMMCEQRALIDRLARHVDETKRRKLFGASEGAAEMTKGRRN